MIAMRNKKIAIWGAGNIGKQAFEFLEENVECFIDNDVTRWDSRFVGKIIDSPQKFKSVAYKYDVVIASVHGREIANQLDEMGFSNYYFYQSFFDDIYTKIKGKNDKKVAIVIEDMNNNNLTMSDYEGYFNFIMSQHSLDIEISCFSMLSLKAIGGMSFDRIYVYAPLTHAEIMYKLKDYQNVENLYEKRGFEIDRFVITPLPNDWDSERKSSDWIRNIKSSGLVEATDSYVETVNLNEEIPLFQLVEIETINRCNGICSFCPVNVHSVQREKRYMSDELFSKIINDLENIQYSGRISLFSNNEPFLDKNIIQRQIYAKKHLPNAIFHLFTNGTIMTLKDFKTIIENVDHLVIDNYNDVPELLPKVKEIVDYCKTQEGERYQDRLTVYIRKNNEILSTRGGEAPNGIQHNTFLNNSCALPFQQLVIRPDGKVSLCCNDPLGRFTLGDINTESIMEVWNGNKYAEIRKLIKRGRKNILHCSKCDHFQIY